MVDSLILLPDGLTDRWTDGHLSCFCYVKHSILFQMICISIDKCLTDFVLNDLIYLVVTHILPHSGRSHRNGSPGPAPDGRWRTVLLSSSKYPVSGSCVSWQSSSSVSSCSSRSSSSLSGISLLEKPATKFFWKNYSVIIWKLSILKSNFWNNNIRL